MPRVIQWLTYLIPLRYFLEVVRGVFLKGIGLDVLWPQVAALLAWGTGIVTLAVLRSSNSLARASSARMPSTHRVVSTRMACIRIRVA